jgi:xanthine dehydrogenase/oxidase
MDSLQVKLANLYKQTDVTPYGEPLTYFNVDRIISELKVTSDYDRRLADIVQFNKNNRWKKRGISMVPLKWGFDAVPIGYLATVSIYGIDGSIYIAHAGIEMG